MTTILNNPAIQDIFETLALNIKHSQDLLGLLSSETVALRAMDTQELLRLSTQKNTLLLKIQFLDEALKNHLADNEPASRPEPSHAYGSSVVPETFKLTGLIKLMPEDKKEAATQCKKKLNKIRQDILTKNYINKKFTEDTLGHLGDAITLFTQPVIKQNIYSANGIPPQRMSSLPQLLSREV